MKTLPDYVLRRVIVEFGRRYVYATLTDSNGKIHEEELWKQPYMLEAKEANEDAREAWQALYQHMQDTIVFPSARDGRGDAKPEV